MLMSVFRSAALVFICAALALTKTGAFAGGVAPPPPPPPPPPPALEITDFMAVNNFSNIWIFTGKVTGGDGSPVTINFGDAPSMVGKSTPVNADGTFSYTTRLTKDDYGEVTAQAVDTSGEMSGVDFLYIFNP
jgi:hypothetical protein